MIQTRVIEQGKYKTITNVVVNDIINLIKSTKNQTHYQNVKIRYEATEERPGFLEQQDLIKLGIYTHPNMEMVFGVFLKLNRDLGEDKIIVDGYSDFGEIDDDSNVDVLPNIEVHLAFPGVDEEQYYTQVMAWLKDVVRHELEHLLQRGVNAKPHKHKRLNFSRRAVIAGKPAEFYKYFILSDEIEPNLYGLRSMSQYKRQSFDKTIQEYLQFLCNNGTIVDTQKKLILQKWRPVAKRLQLPKF